LTPELNPSAQRCLTRFFKEDFASLTLHFVNIYVKNQQIHQSFIQFIMYGSSCGKIEKNEMGGACGAHGRRERCVQGVGGEARGKEAIGETQTQVGG
jgi:hypothetical protein